ncbi:hypothetical protein AXG93_4368s1710 [Marchantia polymorpha subsp. ruderalis]|uniref:F-box domain-containing protein n=1 Tax=Marchantia polymorpha subsp. ruderalis TaxID=1480154 RepID=A0A176VZH8_MARPO|nr:hypothetical protein AXG93_4368s1710 [Marchantia polymorpha subsp. ruderalis]
MLVLQKVRDPRTLAACTCVSKKWREKASDEKLMRRFCKTQWPSLKCVVGKKARAQARQNVAAVPRIVVNTSNKNLFGFLAPYAKNVEAVVVPD